LLDFSKSLIKLNLKLIIYTKQGKNQKCDVLMLLNNNQFNCKEIILVNTIFGGLNVLSP
jgi:hypothetical protein